MDIDFEEKVVEFKSNGVFIGEFGNMMLLGVLNVLRMLVIVFIVMEYFVIIFVLLRLKFLIGILIYLVFNYVGLGYYDVVIFRDLVINSSSNCEDEILFLFLNIDDIRSFFLVCRCGKGRVKKRFVDGNLKEFCG